MRSLSVVVCLFFLFFLFGSAAAAADNGVTVTLDGKEVEFEEGAEPFIDEHDRTQVSLRFISEDVGAKVEWDPEKRAAIIVLEDRRAEFVIGEEEYTINGERRVMDTAPRIENQRTFIPPRFVADALGLDIKWIPEARTVALETEEEALPPKTDFDSLNLALLGQCTVTGIEMEQKVWIKETGLDEIDFRMELYSEGDLWVMLIYNHEEEMGYTYSGDTGEWETHEWTVDDLREEEDFEEFWELAEKHDEGDHFMDEAIEWEVQTIERNIEIEDDKFTPPENDI